MTCVDCGEALPWRRIGRPRLRCEQCAPIHRERQKAKSKARRRQEATRSWPRHDDVIDTIGEILHG